MRDRYNARVVLHSGLLAACVLLSGCQILFSLDPVVYDAPVDAPPCTPRSVATGRSHTCIADNAGSVRCWGSNQFGQSVPAGMPYVLEPTIVSLPMPATQVTAGRNFTCALLEDTSVWCWGNNERGEIGQPPINEELAATRIEGIGPTAEVRAGTHHVCSRRSDDGTVFCWGRNGEGQSGQLDAVKNCVGASDVCVVPSPVANTENSKALVIGHQHACVIDGNDGVACWGRNLEGQLGTTGPSRATPMLLTQLGEIVGLSAAGRATCAIRGNGNVSCWGQGDEGQLATGAFEGSTAPVGTQITDARSLALGTLGGCALLRDGTLSCWGNHDAGDGSPGIELMPASPELSAVAEVASHFKHTCAVVNGGVACWGEDVDGQLGRGSRSIATRPVKVPTLVGDMLSAGESHACAVTDTGEVMCWGTNQFGESGNVNLQTNLSPTSLGMPLGKIDGIAAAFAKTCVWGNGQAKCWGRGGGGGLGNGTDERAHPMPASMNTTNVAQVALGYEHVCVRHLNNTISCFGQNAYGQLGNGTTTASLTAVQVTSSMTPIMVSTVFAGESFTCGVLGNGAVYCWGRNEFGQLGNGNNNNSSSPVAVDATVGLGVVLEGGAGAHFACVRDANLTVWCWGRNSRGQLADGTRTHRNRPVKVVLAGNAARLYVGARGACARLNTGTVQCWGEGEHGQLGDGLAQDSLAPVVVDDFANPGPIAIGGDGRCALVGTDVRCTGQHHMLGDGDDSRSRPVPIASGLCQ